MSLGNTSSQRDAKTRHRDLGASHVDAWLRNNKGSLQTAMLAPNRNLQARVLTGYLSNASLLDVEGQSVTGLAVDVDVGDLDGGIVSRDRIVGIHGPSGEPRVYGAVERWSLDRSVDQWLNGDGAAFK